MESESGENGECFLMLRGPLLVLWRGYCSVSFQPFV